MNKKQMKKEQERLKKERNQVYFDLNSKSGIKNSLLISLGVVLFIGIIFVCINIFNGTWNLFTRKNATVNDQGDDRVICGTMFNKSDSEYLVLAYDFSSDDQIIYPSLKESYGGTTAVYLLDLHSGFNKSCVSSKSNITSSLDGLKLSGPTLLRIKGSKIVGHYTTKESIKDYFAKLK